MMAVHLARSRVGLLARLSGLHDGILVLPGGAVRVSVAGLRATYGEKYPYPVPFDYVNKKYNWFTALYERTIHRFNENSKIIVVEGNIGIGKTDFAKRLAKEFDLKFFPATPERDCYMFHGEYDLRKLDPLLPPAARFYDLKKFYSDPHPERGLIGKLLLHWYEAKFYDYLAALRHLVSTGQGVVMVGSAYSDSVFVEALRNMGWVSANFVKYYNNLRTQSICELYRPHLTIYLDAPISVVRQRINQANDPRVAGSRNLTDEFLEMIHRVYQKRHLPKMRESGEVVEIDWTEIATQGDMDAIAEELQNLKLEGEDNEDPKFSDWARQDEDDWTKFRANLEDPKWPLQFVVLPDPWDCPELMMDVDDRIAIGDMTRKHPLFAREKGFAWELGDNPLFSFKINKCCCMQRTFLKPLL